jgi:hypothetical protein
MADYSATFEIAREMRPSGLNLRRLAQFALPLAATVAPLVLFQYSLKLLLSSSE